MDIGFETIGNATVIAYDRGPVLVTDPWVAGSAYFGSWAQTHEIPEEQMAAIQASRFIWFSHGHPDHLNMDSLPVCRDKQILLPNHIGGRLEKDLTEQGFKVQVLPDRVWTPLSERIKVLCIADYNQDAVLLIDINGRLVLNSNDAAYCGWENFVSRVVRSYPISFRLAISGIGDADMCNYFDEQGQRLSVLPNKADVQLGAMIARHTDRMGCKYFVPFSSMHRYQRTDSLWANAYVSDLGDYACGYKSSQSRILPAYLRYDCASDVWEEIAPQALPAEVFEPEHFGDRWSDELSAEDFTQARGYFQAIEHLGTVLDFINLRVGGRDNVIEFKTRGFARGITFEVPRQSLMTAVEYEVFDDLLIGNFMKTTLHGKWPLSGLRPDFSAYVGKYADNGKARTLGELDAYFQAYQRRAPLDYLRSRLEQRGINVLRATFNENALPYRLAQKVYRAGKKVF